MVIAKDVGTVESKTYCEYKDLRVHSISRLVHPEKSLPNHELHFTTMPLKYGIGIEQRNKDGSYCVICFIKLDKDDEIKVEPVCERVENYIKGSIRKFKRFRKAYLFATNLLKNLQEEEEEV